jgi:hypothetical protein
MDAAELSEMSVAIRKPARSHNADDNLPIPLALSNICRRTEGVAAYLDVFSPKH